MLDQHTAETLGIANGNVIDVVVNHRCEGLACPGAPGKIISTPHYLDVAQRYIFAQVYEVKIALPTPERINIAFLLDNGFYMHLRMKKDGKLIHAMQTFVSYARVDLSQCRFFFDVVKLDGSETPREVRIPSRFQRLDLTVNS